MIKFPDNPVDGEEFQLTGLTLIYNNEFSTWAPVDIELPVDLALNRNLMEISLGWPVTAIIPLDYYFNHRTTEFAPDNR